MITLQLILIQGWAIWPRIHFAWSFQRFLLPEHPHHYLQLCIISHLKYIHDSTNVKEWLDTTFHVQYQYCNLKYLLILILVRSLLFSSSKPEAAAVVKVVVVSLFTSNRAKSTWAFGLGYWIGPAIVILTIIWLILNIRWSHPYLYHFF